MRLAAQSLSNNNSALGAFYRRMKKRLGPAKANTAIAHKLGCIFYRMLKYGTQYVDPGVDYYERKYRDRLINNLKRKAKALGFELVENKQLILTVSYSEIFKTPHFLQSSGLDIILSFP